MTHVFIDGAVGTTGLEIEARLTGRSEFEVVTLDEAKRKDAGARREALNDANIVILCLPDDAARDAVAMIDSPSVRVIDASSAHRTAPGWTYGFPELGFDVAHAPRVSNPGCYPTGFLALVAPLVRAGLIPQGWALTCNSVSGYSGGGKALIGRYEHDDALGHRAYGFALDHKHLAEMRTWSGLDHAPVFAPAVTRAFRGMIVEVPLALSALPARPSRAALLDTMTHAFEGSAIVRVDAHSADEILIRGDATASDRLDLHVFTDRGETQARLVAVLDNLGKGASGAAVQSLNLMCGLPETAGLRL